METTIAKGPFKGESFPLDRLIPIMDEDRPGLQARFSDATQMFLEKFPPTDGWQIQVTSALASLDMRSYAQGEDANTYPSMMFQASLISPQGTTIATASTLWVINGPTAYEKGETNARLRLYQAAGLPTRFEASSPPQGASSASALKVAPASEPERSKEPTAATQAKEEVQAGEAPSDDVEPQNTDQDSSQEPEAEAAASPVPAGPDAPSRSLLKSIETQCKMRGIAVPVLTTKADAMAFLRSLGGS